MRGRLITFEGMDGTGKSTQLKLLVERMKQEGYDVLETKEPGSPAEPTKLGLELRTILFHTVTTLNMAPGVADLLFLADHVQHVEKLIIPSLAEGKVVISDRYSDSQFAYGGSRCQSWIMDAYRAAFGPIPDITVLFVAADPANALERANARRGETHQAGKNWNKVNEQIAIQQRYLDQLVGQARTIVITVYPEQTPGQVFEAVWGSVSNALRNPVEMYTGEESSMIELPGQIKV